MPKQDTPVLKAVRWSISRAGMIYIIVLIFCFTCVDLKTLELRVKLRHLNDAIPDFSDMIIFAQDQASSKEINWQPYKKYFKLILSYMPDDVITRQLLGFVDYYSGQEAEAIKLFKSSSDFQGHPLFWSNYDLGVIYYKKGMWPQAAESLFKAISSSPQLAVLLMQDSIIYRQISVSPFFKYSLVDSLKDEQSKAYILLLSSLYHTGQYGKVIYIANLAVSNPYLLYKDAFYYYAGLSFLQAGDMEKAFLLFQKSLGLEKNNPDVYYYIGEIYEHAGQLSQAREYLQASYTLHQSNDPRFPYESHVNLRFF